MLGWLAAFFAIASDIYVWSSAAVVERIIAGQLGLVGQVSVDRSVQVVGFLLTMMPIGIGLYALAQIQCLCSDMDAATVFTVRFTQSLRRFAFALLALVGCGFLVRIAFSVLLTYHNQPGKRMLSIGISSDMIVQVIAALLILALVAVLNEASRIASEHKQFV
ncbi:MAG: DUF2975 domain-containing protein [Gammaproteobacteria bacterium]